MIRNLVVCLLALASALLAPRSHAVYQTQTGRYLQADPNATAMVLMDWSSYHGRYSDLLQPQIDLERRFGDGANLYQYLGSDPWMRTDPSGLFFMPGPGDFVSGAMRSMLAEYSARQEWDVEWALDWDTPDNLHSRLDDSWVEIAILRGLYEEYDFAIPFTDLTVNPLDAFAGATPGRLKSAINYFGRGMATFTQVRKVIVNGKELKAYLYAPPGGGRMLARFDPAAIKKQVRVQITNPTAERKAASRRAFGNPEHALIFEGVQYRWHHHSFKPGLMQLIPEDIHKYVGHTGRAGWPGN